MPSNYSEIMLTKTLTCWFGDGNPTIQISMRIEFIELFWTLYDNDVC